MNLDFPRNTQLSTEQAAQNQSLARKYGVNGYPTLIVTDLAGKELGRSVGYAPGMGPDEVIAYLKPFVPH